MKSGGKKKRENTQKNHGYLYEQETVLTHDDAALIRSIFSSFQQVLSCYTPHVSPPSAL